MRVDRLTLLSGSMLLIWLLLYMLNSVVGEVEGASTIFLPISISLLFVHELRAMRPPFDISLLFLASCLFFFCISLILWPVTSFAPTYFESLVTISFTLKEFDAAAFFIGFSIAITILTMAICRSKVYFWTPSIFVPKSDSRGRNLYRFGFVLMVFSLPVVLMESWQQFLYIKDIGYLELYTDGPQLSLGAKLFFYLFYLGFGFTFTFTQSQRAFLWPAFFYLTVATLDALKGARGALLVPISFVIWFYLSRFNSKMGLRGIVRNLLLLVGLFVILTYQRDPELFSSSILQFFADALASQGRSLQLTVLYQRSAEEIALYGNNMVLSNLLIPITALLHPEIREAAQSMDQVMYSNNLKHILTYVLNPSYYFTGGGTGGVYTVELIEAGAIAYVMLSIGLGWFFAWVPKAMQQPWVRFMSIYFFTTIFYLPRGEFFFNTLIVGKALVLYLIIIGLHGIIKWRKNFVTASPQMSLVGSKV